MTEKKSEKLFFFPDENFSSRIETRKTQDVLILDNALEIWIGFFFKKNK